MLTDRAWARRGYRASGGRLGRRFAHEPVLLITTTGRKTGKRTLRSTGSLWRARRDSNP